MGNMREISIEECNAVFGGTDEELAEITVTATRKYYDSPTFQDTFWGSGSGSSTGFGSYGTGLESYLNDFTFLEYDPVRDGQSGLAVDEDRDGDIDVIVVNPTSPSGYFAGVGLGVGVFGGMLQYDISGERWYVTPEVGFGTPVQVQIGYSHNVTEYLSGLGAGAVSGNPGVPVISYNGQTVDLNTSVLGTPSVGVGYGQPVPTLGEIMAKIESDARILREGLYDWMTEGSFGTLPTP